MSAQLKRENLSVKEPERPLFTMNMYFHAWGHQFLYDRQTLQSALRSVGFRDVRFPAPQRKRRSGIAQRRAAHLRDWE